MWHEATAELRERGDVALLGIVQEQHPDRARLFMQWKRMEWPVLVDSLNELGVAVVPLVVFIDEHGIVRGTKPARGGIAATVEAFAARSFEPPDDPPPAPAEPDLDALRDAAAEGGARARRAYARALVKWAAPQRLGEAIAHLKAAAAEAPDHGPTHFQLGVAYRKRYDSPRREAGDFQHAAEHWGRALEIDPNQYIWRRRIQQYGPRLAKPYSFYDWVSTARAEIEARGETPVPLAVEPGGAEIAHPRRGFTAADPETAEPDPQARIHRDRRGFIVADAAVVPATVKPGATIRVHLVFRPNRGIDAHWNNEAEPMQVWIEPPPGWTADRRLHTVPNAASATSLETRTVEVELQAPQDAAPGAVTLEAHALYNVCEGAAGTCLYRRQDLAVPVRVGGG